MPFDTHINLLIGTVQIPPVPSTTGLTLTLMPGDASRFQPNTPLTLAPPLVQPNHDNSEIAYVTAVNGNQLTITRAQEGTNRMQVAGGWKVIGSITAKTITDLEDAIGTKVDKVANKQLSTEDYTTAEQAKLAGIAPGATQNASDAALRDRSTHTRTQAISTVSGLQTALDGKVDENADIVPATKIKVTYDKKGLTVGSGRILRSFFRGGF